MSGTLFVDNDSNINLLLQEMKGIMVLAKNAPEYEGVAIELEKAIEYYQKYIELICAEKDVNKRKRLYVPKSKLQTNKMLGDLKPEYEALLTNLERDTDHGIHLVKMVNEVHYKLWPHAPGVEYMVDSLSKVIARSTGDKASASVSAPSELLKIIDKHGRHYPYMASRTVIGSELQFILEQRPEAIDLVDRENFSAMVVLSMLTNPQDGKPDNYMVDIDFNPDNSIKTYKILGIDNDMAFVPALIRHKSPLGDYYDVTVKNVLYFFPQMEEVIAPKFRENFIQRSPEDIMVDWLAALHDKNTVYQNLLDKGIFSQEEFGGFKEYHALLDGATREGILRVETEFNDKYGELLGRKKEEEKTGKACGIENANSIIKHGLQLPIKFKEGQATGVYKKLIRIKALLTHTNITHMELLRGVERVVARYYEEVKREIEEEKIPGNEVTHCIWKVYGKKEYANIPKPKVEELIEKAKNRGDSSGLTTLATAAVNEYGLEDGRIQSICEAAEEFIASIDFSKMNSDKEHAILLKIQKDLRFIRNLEIKGSCIKSSEELDNLVDSFPELKSITLVDMKDITTQAIIPILKKWKFSRCNIKLVIEDCAEILTVKEWQLLVETGYKEIYLRASKQIDKIYIKRTEFAIGKEKPEVLLAFAVSEGVLVKELYDYLQQQVKEKEEGGDNSQKLNGLVLQDLVLQRIDTVIKYPLLHTASRSGHVNVIEFLLSQGAKINVEYKNETALDKAVSHDKTDAAVYLYQKGGHLSKKLAGKYKQKLESMLKNRDAEVQDNHSISSDLADEKEPTIGFEEKEAPTWAKKVKFATEVKNGQMGQVNESYAR